MEQCQPFPDFPGRHRVLSSRLRPRFRGVFLGGHVAIFVPRPPGRCSAPTLPCGRPLREAAAARPCPYLGLHAADPVPRGRPTVWPGLVSSRVGAPLCGSWAPPAPRALGVVPFGVAAFTSGPTASSGLLWLLPRRWSGPEPRCFFRSEVDTGVDLGVPLSLLFTARAVTPSKDGAFPF